MKTRSLVPFLICGKVWDWLFAEDLPGYTITIPVRHYSNLQGRWYPKMADVEFKRVHRFHDRIEGSPVNNEIEDEKVAEIFYENNNDRFFLDRDRILSIRG